MLKILLFDFDGIITDTETAVYHAVRDWFFERTGHRITLEEYGLAAGSWHVQFLSHLKNDRGLRFNAEEFETFYINLEGKLLQHLPLMPGVRKWLDDAHRLGVRTGIVSSNLKRTLTERMKKLNLFPEFEFMVTAEDVSALKPAPDLYEKGLEMAGVSRREALVIEDSMNGIRSATAAGLRTLAVPCEVTRVYPFEEAWQKADSLADISLEEVRAAFQSPVTTA